MSEQRDRINVGPEGVRANKRSRAKGRLRAIYSGGSGGLESLERRTMLAAVTVNWTDVRQSVDGFGASSAWQSVPTTTAAEQLYSETNGIGLTLLKSHIESDGTTGENGHMQQAAAYGAKVWSAAWTPPREWKTNADRNRGGSLKPEYYQAYADLLASYVLNCKAVGVELDYLSLQNETDYAASWESCTWSEQQLAAFVPVIAQTFAAKGITTKLLAPEEAAWTFDRVRTIMANPSLSQYIGVLAGHHYAPEAFPYAKVTGTMGLNVWQTEIFFGDGTAPEIDDALVLADDISQAFEAGGVSAYHYWRLGNPSGVSSEGLMTSSWQPTKRLWAMGQYSRFVRPGWVMIGETDDGGLDITTFKDPVSGRFAIVTVNSGTSAVNESFTLSGASAGSVTRYITSGAAGDDLRQDGTITLVGGTGFTSSIPARSIVTFYGQATGSPTLVAPGNFTAAPQYPNLRTQMQLSWDDLSTSETSYTVERSSNGTTWSTLVSNLPANTTGYVDTNLTELARYYYRVKAVSGGVSSAWSTVADGMTILGSSFNVTTFTPQPANGFNLQWVTSSTKYTGVIVDRSLDGFNWTRIATLGNQQTYYTDANIPGYDPNQVYFYRVRNTFGSTVSGFGDYVTTLKAPTGFTAAASPMGTSLTFGWTNVATASFGATIQQLSGASTWTSVSPSSLTVTPNTFTLSGLTENTSYTFRLKALYNSDSVASAATPNVVVTTPVALPTNLTAVSLSASTAKLTWADNSAVETSYVVERSVNGTSWTTIATALATGSTGYTDSAAPAGAVYYRVKAVSGSVSSVYASTLLVAALPVVTAAPGTVTGTTTALSVPALSSFGTSPRTYTWSLDGTPPAGVTYSANGTASSNSTTVTFDKAGSYTFRLVVTDAAGYSTTATKVVTVSAVLSSISVTATGTAIVKNTWQQCVARGYDQFEDVLASQPSFAWSVVSGGGSISAGGLYAAGGSASSPVVRATSGSVSGQATLSVQNTATLLASYAFNEGSGTAARDLLGAGVTGSLSGSVTYSAGRLGTAALFDGASGSVWLGNPDELDVVGQITLSAWIKPASSVGITTIVGRSGGSSPRGYTTLRLNAGKYEVGSWDGTTTYLTNSAIPAGDYNTWVHIAATYDGKAWHLYRNGVDVASTNSAVGALSFNCSWRVGSSDVPDRYFNGAIDSVRIYGQALSSSEVAGLFGQGIVVTSPAAAIVAGKTANLSIAALDPDTNSDANFRYTWTSVSGPGGVTFLQNGTLAAKNSVATFAQAGTYVLGVTVTDPSGMSTAQNLTITMTSSLTALAISPSSATLAITGQRQFGATATDQFGQIFSPALSWAVTVGLGSVTSGGLFTAAASPGLSTVRVSSGGMSASASVSIVVPAPEGLVVSGITPGQVTLGWGAVGGASGYNLYRSTTPGGQGGVPINTSVLTGTSYTDTTVSQGVTYYYVVRAIASTVVGAASAEVAATAVLLSPTSVLLDASSDTGVFGDSRTNRNNAGPGKALALVVGGTAAGATVRAYAGGVLIGSAVATGSTTVVTTDGSTALGDGTWTITATQAPAGGGPTGPSPALAISIDTVAPVLSLAGAGVPTGEISMGTASVPVGFSEPVLGFALAGLGLSRDGLASPLTAWQAPTTADQSAWTVPNLGTLTARPGSYAVTVSSAGITDLAGNSLVEGATAAWANNTLNGTSGTDSLTVSFTGASTAMITANSAPEYSLDLSALSRFVIDGAGATDQLVLSGAAPGSTMDLGLRGTMTLTSVADLPTVRIAGAGTDISTPRLRATRLVVEDGATLRTTGGTGSASVVDAVTVSATGVFDLGAADLIVRNGAAGGGLSGIQSLVTQSRLRTTVTTPAFTTLGAFDNDAGNSVPHFSSYDGVTGLTATDVIVKFTYLGDTDLDGQLTGKDFARVLEGFSTGQTGWGYGDVDNSGGPISLADWTAFYAAYTYYQAHSQPNLGNGTGAGGGTSGGSGGTSGGTGDGGGGSGTPLARGGVPAIQGGARLVYISTALTNIVAGSNLGRLQVELRDEVGNLATAVESKVTVVLRGTSSGSTKPILLGTTTMRPRNGRATFSNLAIRQAGSYTLEFTDGSYPPATSPTFTVVPAKPQKVVFASLPVRADARAPENIAGAIVDRYGNVGLGGSFQIRSANLRDLQRDRPKIFEAFVAHRLSSYPGITMVG